MLINLSFQMESNATFTQNHKEILHFLYIYSEAIEEIWYLIINHIFDFEIYFGSW